MNEINLSIKNKFNKLIENFRKLNIKQKLGITSLIVISLLLITLIINFDNFKVRSYIVTKNYEKLYTKLESDISKVNLTSISNMKKKSIIKKDYKIIKSIINTNEEDKIVKLFNLLNNSDERLLEKGLYYITKNNFVISKSNDILKSYSNLRDEKTKIQMVSYFENYLKNIDINLDTTDSLEEIILTYFDTYFSSNLLKDEFREFIDSQNIDNVNNATKATIAEIISKDEINIKLIGDIYSYIGNDIELYDIDFNGADLLVKIFDKQDILSDYNIKTILRQYNKKNDLATEFLSKANLNLNELNKICNYFINSIDKENDLSVGILHNISVINGNNTLIDSRKIDLEKVIKDINNYDKAKEEKIAEIDKEASNLQSKLSEKHVSLRGYQDELSAKESYFGAHIYVVGRIGNSDEFEGAKSYYNSFLNMELPTEERCIIIPTDTSFQNKGTYNMTVYQIETRTVTLKEEVGGFEQKWPVFKEVSKSDYEKINTLKSNIQSTNDSISYLEGEINKLSNKREEAKSGAYLTELNDKKATIEAEINKLENDINNIINVIIEKVPNLEVEVTTSNENNNSITENKDNNKSDNEISSDSSNTIKTEDMIIGTWTGQGEELVITASNIGNDTYKVLSVNNNTVNVEINYSDGQSYKYKFVIVDSDKIMMYLYNEATGYFTGGSEYKRK